MMFSSRAKADKQTTKTGLTGESAGYFCCSHRPLGTRLENPPQFWCLKPGISARWGKIQIGQGEKLDIVKGKAIGIVAGVPSAVSMCVPF